jgi:hypothetical protein
MKSALFFRENFRLINNNKIFIFLFQVYSTPDDKNLLLKNFDFLTADTMIVSQQDGTVAVIDTRTSK